jgi:hypothetical protein
VLHLQLIILSVGSDIPVDNETLLMIDFVNFKIKPAQSFKCAYRDRICVPIFIGVSAHIYIYIYKYLYLYYVKKYIKITLLSLLIQSKTTRKHLHDLHSFSILSLEHGIMPSHDQIGLIPTKTASRVNSIHHCPVHRLIARHSTQTGTHRCSINKN